MSQKYNTSIKVNGKNIETNSFVETYIANTTVAIVRSLKGVDYLKKVQMQVEEDEVEMEVNGERVELTQFPQDIIASTVRGLVSVLKGAEDSRSIVILVGAE